MKSLTVLIFVGVSLSLKGSEFLKHLHVGASIFHRRCLDVLQALHDFFTFCSC